MFGFHIHKYGEIKDGYQYCSVCGKASSVAHEHKFELLKQINEFSDYNDKIPSNIKWIKECTKCGIVVKYSSRD